MQTFFSSMKKRSALSLIKLSLANAALFPVTVQNAQVAQQPAVHPGGSGMIPLRDRRD
jgi:hypothetical protein